MTSPLGAEGVLCDCSAPSNRECVYMENVVEGRPQATSNDEKSLRKSLHVFLQGKCSW